MAHDHIYRRVDVRALTAPLATGKPPCAAAQLIWSHLLIGPHTTPVPGLVLVRRSTLLEETQLHPRMFNAGWKELVDDGRVEADWDVGVVVLTNALRQQVHRPGSTSSVVQIGLYTSVSVPRCALTDSYRERIRDWLREIGPAWLDAFDSQRRRGSGSPPNKKTGDFAGGDEKPNANRTATRTQTEQPPEASPEPQPNPHPNASGGGSQDTGDRIQELKAPPARDAQAEAHAREAAAPGTSTPAARAQPKLTGGASKLTGGAFSALFTRLTKRPAGLNADGSVTLAAVENVRQYAALQEPPVEPSAMAEALVAAQLAMLADWKRRKVAHHCQPTVDDLADAKYFAKVCGWLEQSQQPPATSGAPPEDDFSPDDRY